MLQLTRELSVLAGCLWQWSLMNRRADRNDFLLLHRFHDLKFICPERQMNKKKEEMDDDEEFENREETEPVTDSGVSSKKKVAI